MRGRRQCGDGARFKEVARRRGAALPRYSIDDMRRSSRNSSARTPSLSSWRKIGLGELLSRLRSGARSHVVVFVAAVALLLQGMAPLAHEAALDSARRGVPGWMAGYLCLALTLPEKAPGKEAPAKNLPLCPICLGLHLATTYLPPNAPALAAPAEIADVRFARLESSRVPALYRSPVQARAPPPAV